MPGSCRPYQQSNRYHLCRRHHRAYRRWGTWRKHLLQQRVSSLSNRKQRWQELELPVVPLSEKNSAGRTGQPRTLWLRGGVARKQRETRLGGRWNIGVRFPEWWWHSIFGTRGWFLPRKRFPPRKKCSLQQKNCVQLIFLNLRCYKTMGLPWPFVVYALVEIVIRFFDTDLLVPIRLSVIEI